MIIHANARSLKNQCKQMHIYIYIFPFPPNAEKENLTFLACLFSRNVPFLPKLSTQINSVDSSLTANPTTPEFLTYTLAQPLSRSSLKVPNGLKALVSHTSPHYHTPPYFSPLPLVFIIFQTHLEVVI